MLSLFMIKLIIKLYSGSLGVHSNVINNVCIMFLGVHRFTLLPPHIPTLSEPKPNVATMLLQHKFVSWVITVYISSFIPSDIENVYIYII